MTNWNKDDIIDFAHELDAHRNETLSDECTRFLRAYMLRDLPDDQLQFFERTLLISLLQDLKKIYDDSRADLADETRS